MKIKKIKVENFMSFRKMSFCFDDYLYLIDGVNVDENSANGSGKSSFLDAISYLLFGEIPRKSKLDDLSFNQVGGFKISGTLETDKGDFEIIRGRKPNIFTMSHNRVPILGQDQKDLQRKLEKIFKINFDIFTHSVYFHQNSMINFFDASDSFKKDIFTELLGVGIFDEANGKAKKKLVLLNNDIFESQKNRENILSLIDIKSKDLKIYQEKSGQFEEIKEKDLLNCNFAITEAKEEISQLDLSIQSQSSFFKEIDEVSFKDNKDKIRRIIEKRAEILAAYKSLNFEIVKLNREKENIESFKQPVCPKCFQKTSFEVLGSQINEIKNSVISKESQKEVLNKQVTTLNKGEENIKSLVLGIEQQKESFEREKSKAKIEERVREEKKAMLERNLKKALDHKETISSRSNDYLNLISETQKYLFDFNEKLSNLGIKEEKLGKSKELFSFIEEMFGQKGLKSQIFTKLLNELTFRSNQYLSELFNESVKLTFKSESELSSGRITQKISTEFLINGKPFPVPNLSGGEKRRVILAVNLALSDIISNRSDNPFTFFIFDECFDGLDKIGKEKIMQLLRKLKQDRSYLLVVDHSSEFQSLFDQIIKIEKRNGESSIL